MGFFKGFILGGLVGLSAGLLFAPKSGKETMAELHERSAEFRSRGLQKLEEESVALRATIADMREVLNEAVQEGREVLKEAVEEGRDATTQATQDLHGRYNESRGPQ